MRKTLIAVLIIVIAAGVWAAYHLSQKKQEKTLTFWHIMNYSPVKEVVESAVERFKANNPGVDVEINAIKNDAFKTKLELAFKGGEPPDIFHTWGGGVLRTRLNNNLVATLDPLFADLEFKGRILPAALSFCYVDDKPACVPLDLSIVPVFYNRQMFEDRKLEVPGTFDELLAVCAKLRADGIEPIALGNSDKWPGCFFYVYGATRAGGRTPIMKVESRIPGSFNNAAFLRAGDIIKSLVDKNCFNMGFQGMKDDAARRLLLNNKAGMMVMGTWFIARVMDEAPDMLPNLGCFPFPALSDAPTGDAKAVVGGTNCAFAVSSKCKYPELAMELLRYLSDATTVVEWAKTGRIPAISGAPASLFNPLTKEALTILENASSIQLYYDQLLPPALGEKHKETVQALFSGNLTPKQVCDEMDKALPKAWE